MSAYLVFSVNEPGNRLFGDILKGVTQLIEERDVDFPSKLGRGLVQQLDNLLRHKQRRASAVGGVRSDEEDLADEVANLMGGGKGGK